MSVYVCVYVRVRERVRGGLDERVQSIVCSVTSNGSSCARLLSLLAVRDWDKKQFYTMTLADQGLLRPLLLCQFYCNRHLDVQTGGDDCINATRNNTRQPVDSLKNWHKI